jgi:hypothetical protein
VADPDLSESAGFGRHFDSPGVLLDDDVITERQAEPVPWPAGFVVKRA